MSAVKDKIMEEIWDASKKDPKNSEFFKGLYDQIDQIESDVDVYNYLNSSRGYYLQNPAFSTTALNDMSTVRDALFGNLKTGKVNLDKEFGDKWYYEDLPYQQIQFVADKQGVDFAKLNKEMTEEAIRRKRYDIAHGDAPDSGIMDKIGAGAMTLFGKRQQEAIERGEDPTVKDYVGDIAEQGLYMMPWARGAGMVTKGAPRIAKVLSSKPAQLVAGNVTAPLATEVYDANVYNEGPRSEFSVADVAAGSTINATAPYLLKGLLMGGGKLFGRELPHKFMNFAEGKTAKELADEAHVQQSKWKVENADNPAIPQAERLYANKLKKLQEVDPEAYLLTVKNTLYDIARQDGKTFEEKLTNYFNSFPENRDMVNYMLASGDIASAADYGQLKTMLERLQSQDVNVQIPPEIRINEMRKEFNMGDPVPVPKTEYKVLNAYDASPYGIAEAGQDIKQLAKEEAVKNYLTNQFGGYYIDAQDPYARIPVIGSAISRAMKEREEEATKKALEEQILNELKARYQMPGDK